MHRFKKKYFLTKCPVYKTENMLVRFLKITASIRAKYIWVNFRGLYMYKILVIDDSPFIFKAVKKALEPHGFEIVDNAANGQIGLEMYEKYNPDLITLDVTMPIMDGLQTAIALKKMNPNVKIIMLSAMGDDLLLNQAKAIGIKHFLTKPFKQETLLQAVNLLLEE